MQLVLSDRLSSRILVFCGVSCIQMFIRDHHKRGHQMTGKGKIAILGVSHAEKYDYGKSHMVYRFFTKIDDIA